MVHMLSTEKTAGQFAAGGGRIGNMPERREIDKMLRGLTPKHQRQLSVSSSNALERFAVMEVSDGGDKLRAETQSNSQRA